MSEYTFFQIILGISFVVALGIFVTLFFIPAPYGRHARAGWGPHLPNWLGWLLMESVSAVVFLLMFTSSHAPITTGTGSASAPTHPGEKRSSRASGNPCEGSEPSQGLKSAAAAGISANIAVKNPFRTGGGYRRGRYRYTGVKWSG